MRPLLPPLLLAALALSAPCAWAQASGPTPTRLVVRAVAHDAKLLGDVVGGARIVVQDAATGEVLAEGVQEGGTGDTDRILRTPRGPGVAVFDTEGAAAFRATVALARPTLVEVTAYGPLRPAHATLRASRRLWLVPGRHVEGDGIVLEFNGLTVEVLAPGGAVRAGEPVLVRARVTMLCSCPTEPGGLWDADALTVTARVIGADGAVVAEIPLRFAGEPSTFQARLSPPPPGAYRLQAVAVGRQGVDAGVDERPLVVTAPPGR